MKTEISVALRSALVAWELGLSLFSIGNLGLTESTAMYAGVSETLAHIHQM